MICPLLPLPAAHLEPAELLVEEPAAGSSVALLTETGMTAGAFNGAKEKEEDTGRKNGVAVLFDLNCKVLLVRRCSIHACHINAVKFCKGRRI